MAATQKHEEGACPNITAEGEKAKGAGLLLRLATERLSIDSCGIRRAPLCEIIHYTIEKITRDKYWMEDMNFSIIKVEDAQLQ